ncbi:MAG: MarR family transcriptional regulator [Treponema sp.]|nr:MarR family transcriptional regulator [Treponema sp.]
MKEIRIGLELRTLNNLIRRRCDFSSHKKEIETITGNNGWIIGFLAENTAAGRDVYQKTIEEHFNITRSAVSNALSLMEQKGLITRPADRQDARRKKIVLTEKAGQLKKLMKEDFDAFESTLTKGFSDEELETLYNFFQRMKDNLQNS